jgi:YgiT-type zinc finger domain-containing protein
MICMVCRQQQLIQGFVSIVFNRDKTKLLVDAVPSLICSGCGEAYVNAVTTTKLLELAEHAATFGLSRVTYDYGKLDLSMK